MFKLNTSNKKSSKRGFTLIEILIVIGLIAILATIVLIAINPARQFAQARDSQRTSNLNTILNAIGQRIADNKGSFAGPFTVSSIPYTCGPLPQGTTIADAEAITTAMAADTTTETGALGCLVPTYLPAFPNDPTAASGTDTGYLVFQEIGTGRVHVIADALESAITRDTPIEIVR